MNFARGGQSVTDRSRKQGAQMKRPIVFVILAAMGAMLAAIVVFSAIRKRESEVQRAMAQTVQIVVAATDIPLGTKLEPDSVKLVRWSRDSVPQGGFTDPQAIADTFAKTQFEANEPIVASKLFMGEKTSGVMPLLIPPGMRAMSVPVDEVSDIAGFVAPHTRVDILVAVAGTGPGEPSFSRIVLQNIEVIAVAQEIEHVKDQPEVVKVVTLLVTPIDAEKLTLASREGLLRLAMRNYSDAKIVATRGIGLPDLLHEGGAPGSTLPVMQIQPRAAAGRSSSAWTHGFSNRSNARRQVVRSDLFRPCGRESAFFVSGTPGNTRCFGAADTRGAGRAGQRNA